jgi:hypothetical protein
LVSTCKSVWCHNPESNHWHLHHAHHPLTSLTQVSRVHLCSSGSN